MNQKNFFVYSFGVIITFFFIGCGGGDNSSISGNSTSNIVSGYLIDSPVVGINYECGNKKGTTESGGKFECENDTLIIFKIGNLIIGSIDGMTSDKNIYLQDIANVSRDNFDDEYTIKLAVLLQSLDDDGDIKNEINIDDSLHSMFTDTMNLKDISLTKLEEIIKASNKEPIFKYKAVEHLKNTFNKSSQKYVTISSDKELITTNGISSKIIKKINTSTESSTPSNLITIGDYTYFTATDDNGRGLWRTDGSEENTILLKKGSFSRLTNIGEILYFVQTRRDNSTSVSYASIWKSDGTVNGTFLIKEFPRTGSYSASIEAITSLNGIAYFRVNDDDNNGDLWKTDGSEIGTVLVKDFPTHFSDITTFNNKIYLSVGKELWESDGTESGTTLITDIGEYIHTLSSTSTKIFMTTLSAKTNLWVSDGTLTGTTKIKTILNYNSDYDPSDFFIFKEKVYFNRNGDIWVSDGTEEGTIELTTDNMAKGYFKCYGWNNEVYFITGHWSWNHKELWKTNGTINSTVKLLELSDYVSPSDSLIEESLYLTQMDRNNGNQSLYEFNIVTEVLTLLKTNKSHGLNSWSNAEGVKLNDKYIFRMSDNDHSSELWISDGSEIGTSLIKDINTKTASSNIQNLVKINNNYYFTALSSENGTELWKTDGTENGTIIVKDIVEGINSSNPTKLTNINGTLYFTAEDTTGISSLWKSDGTKDKTIKIKDGFDYISELEQGDNILYFIGNEDGVHESRLWVSDGTQEGTVPISIDDISPNYLTYVNGSLFFKAIDSIAGSELWKSDGTFAGTQLVKDIKSGTNWSSPRNFFNIKDTLFFSADDGISGRELWKSDGTDAGTNIVKDFNIGSTGSSFGNNIVVDGINYSIINGVLWKITSTEIIKIKEITNVEGYSKNIKQLFKFNNKILLVVDIIDNDCLAYPELWISDGTTDGTTFLKDFKSITYRCGEGYFDDTLMGDKIYFQINNFFNNELSKILTDGTSFGTGIVE